MKKLVDRPRLAVLYRAGVPFREIADEFGVSIATINDVLWRMRRAGWDLPHRRGGSHVLPRGRPLEGAQLYALWSEIWAQMATTIELWDDLNDDERNAWAELADKVDATQEPLRTAARRLLKEADRGADESSGGISLRARGELRKVLTD